MVAKKWVVPDLDRAAQERLARDARCSPVLAALLLRRGISSGEEASRFLKPTLLELADPFELPDMDLAVQRIEEAVRRRHKIGIFGDYDVDGVASTCLLLDFFRLLRYPVQFRLPHRLKEGYGLRPETVDELAEEGVELLLTVDNGSSAQVEVERARRLGMDVVITDHHQPSAERPRAVALVNPWLGTVPGAFQWLAGVGVTFKLVWALSQRFSRAKKLSAEFRQFLHDSLALVALGTISDVVPLLGENRALVHHGLAALENSPRPGIRKMVEVALGANRGERLESSHVGFELGPRINAVGRLGRADLAISLLTTECDEEAAELMAVLDRENKRRRQLQKQIHSAARERVVQQIDLERDRVIVLADAEWHPGVIGIVAAKLAEDFCRPTLLFSINGDRCRGSARSVPGVHFCDALASCNDHLDSYGGHAMAAGAECGVDQLPRLREALNQVIEISPRDMVPEVEADCEVSLRQISSQLLNELSYLSPFGHGNPEPVFAATGLEVVGRPRLVGQDGNHLAFFVRQDNRTFRAVAFGKGDLFPEVSGTGARVSLLFQPRWNHWQGREEIELRVLDLTRISHQPPAATTYVGR